MYSYDYDRRRVIGHDYERRSTTAMEHATPEALKKYLQKHPKADPKNHSVKEKSKAESKEEKGSSVHNARGKGGAGEQRQDWVKQLTHGYTTKNPKQLERIKKLETAAEFLDHAERQFEKATPGNIKPWQDMLKEKFDTYNAALEEMFGDGAKETEPKWEKKEEPKPKPEEKKSEPKKEEKPESKKERTPKHHRFPTKLEDQLEKDYGKVKEVHYEDSHSEDENGNPYDDSALFTVVTNRGLLKVVVNRKTEKIEEVHQEGDDWDD